MSAIAVVTRASIIKGMINPRNWLNIPLNVTKILAMDSGTVRPAAIPRPMAIKILVKSPIFSGYEIKRDVSASSYGASEYSMNITFMLFKDGKEALAILVRKSLSKSHRVVKDTMDALSKNKIPFVDFVQTMPNTQFYIKRKIITGLGI